jgi:flavin-dependent dehydrogenase
MSVVDPRLPYVSGEFVEIETEHGTYSTRAVVRPDGANSVVQRAIVRKHIPQISRLLEVLVLAQSQAPASPGLGNDFEEVSDSQAMIDFSWIADGVQGYIWDFPTQVQTRPMRTRGIFGSRIHSRASRISIKAVLL